MRQFLTLLAKEEKALFTSPIAYVLIAVFLLIMGYSFTLALFVSHTMTLVHLFFQIFTLFLLTVPIITMRLIAEERKLRTMEVLLTSPVTETQIVFAKFAASMSLILLMLILSAAYPIVLATYEIVCSKYPDSATGAAVKAFMQATIGAGQDGLDQYGYIPMPSSFQSKLSDAVNGIS